MAGAKVRYMSHGGTPEAAVSGALGCDAIDGQRKHVLKYMYLVYLVVTTPLSL